MMHTSALIELMGQLELDIERQVRRETDVALQRRLLAVYRHGRALRIALENWQDANDGVSRESF